MYSVTQLFSATAPCVATADKNIGYTKSNCRYWFPNPVEVALAHQALQGNEKRIIECYLIKFYFFLRFSRCRLIILVFHYDDPCLVLFCFKNLVKLSKDSLHATRALSFPFFETLKYIIYKLLLGSKMIEGGIFPLPMEVLPVWDSSILGSVPLVYFRRGRYRSIRKSSMSSMWNYWKGALCSKRKENSYMSPNKQAKNRFMKWETRLDVQYTVGKEIRHALLKQLHTMSYWLAPMSLFINRRIGKAISISRNQYPLILLSWPRPNSSSLISYFLSLQVDFKWCFHSSNFFQLSQ